MRKTNQNQPIEAESNAARLFKVVRYNRQTTRPYALVVKANSTQKAKQARQNQDAFVDIFEINETGAIIG